MKKILRFTKIGFSIGLIFSLTILASCSRKCPNYPVDAIGLMPVDRIGQELIYVSFSDTLKMLCNRPEYFGGNRIRYGMKCCCDVNMTQTAESEIGSIFYVNRFEVLPGEDMVDNYYNTISIEAFGIRKQWMVPVSMKNGIQENATDYPSHVEKLSNWIDSFGRTYGTVYKVWNEGEAERLYLTTGNGLIQIKLDDYEVWTLR